MKKMNIRLQKTKFFWAFFVLGAFILTFGVFLLPVWKDSNVFWKGWGEFAINLFMFLLITIYVFGYLLRKLKKEKNKTIIILIVMEMIILLLIAVGCILEMFDVLHVGGPCVILGAALWLRGVVHIMKGYFYRHTKKEQFSFALLLLAIFFVTIGTALVINPFFDSAHLIWVMASTVLAIGCVTVICGFLAIPHKSTALADPKNDIFVDIPPVEIPETEEPEEQPKKIAAKKSTKTAKKDIAAIEAPAAKKKNGGQDGSDSIESEPTEE